MRRAIHSWTTTLTRLGFRRRPKKRRAAARHRRHRLESLEDRRVLDASPYGTTHEETFVLASQATLPQIDATLFIDNITSAEDLTSNPAADGSIFVLAGESAHLFRVSLVEFPNSAPRAVLSVAPGVDLSVQSEFELDVALMSGQTVISHQRVSILLPREENWRPSWPSCAASAPNR
jgi:hypothetical protein